MSNHIDLIYAKQVETQLKNVKAELVSTYAEMVKISNLKIDFFGGKSPNSQAGLKTTISDYGAIQFATQKVTDKVEKLRLSEIKLQQEREKAFDKFEANNAKEIASLEKANNTYNKVQAKINSLSGEYNDLATRQQLGIKLTDQEANRVAFLTGKILGYENALKRVDAGRGKFGREVGNYSKATDNLNRSLTTIATEIPNFFQSIEIGMRSISNNIQPVRDGLKGVRNEAKELGKEAPSALSAIAKGLLNWQSLLFVGIGLLSAYSGEIANWVKEIWNGSRALNESAKAQDEFNQARLRSSAKTVQEVRQLREYIKIAKEIQALEESGAKLSKTQIDQRTVALQEIRKAGKYYFKDLQDTEIITRKGTLALSAFNDALEARAEREDYLAGNQKTNERIGELQAETDARKKYVEDLRTINDQINQNQRNGDAVKLLKEELKALEDANDARIERRDAIEDATLSSKKDSAITKEILALKFLESQQQRAINKLTRESLILEGDVEKKRKNRVRTEKIDTTPNVEALNAEGAATNSLLDSYENLIRITERYRQALSKDSADYDKYTKQIERLQGAIKLITELPNGNNGIEASKKRAEQYKEEERTLKALNAEVGAFIRSISQDFIGQSSFPSLLQFFDGTFERLQYGAETTAEKFAVTFNAIASVAKDVFAYINKLGEQDYQNASNRLEKQYQISLKFAGESATARTEIERKYEEERVKLARERAKQEKASAIFNTVINTAAAVVAALANPGGPAGVALAAIVGLLGAAQIAVIASEPLPAFKDGGVHKGGLMVVNDAQGSRYQEKVVTPDGKIYSPKGRNVVMNAPSGTEIFTPDQWDRKTVFPSQLDVVSAERRGIVSNGASAQEIGHEFERVMSKRPVMNFRWDKNGIQTDMQKGLTRTNYINNLVSGKGDTV